MTIFPLPTCAPTVTNAGITAPPFEDILESKTVEFRAIYGQDIDLSSDVQDGELVSFLATAIDQTNQSTIGAYLSYSPTFAIGAALSSEVKINGMRRLAASFSTVDLVLVGEVGTPIPAGIVTDSFGNQWFLPPNVVIPFPSGTVTVTATCATTGAVSAGIGTVNQITTIQPGWQTATNPAIAVLGDPVETDAQLRTRQAISTSLPALTPLAAILAAIANIAGVERSAIYENDTSVPDGNGLPRNSIAVVVEGGDAVAVAQTIETKKSPGTGTFGTTSEIVIDQSGVPDTVNFFRVTEKPIYVSITVRRLSGWQTSTATLIQTAVAAALAGLSIGENVFYNRLMAPANLSGDAALSIASGLTQLALDQLSNTYTVTAMTVGLAPNPTFVGDVMIAFNEAASGIPANIVVTAV